MDSFYPFIPFESPASLFIRHGERYELNFKSDSLLVPLTPKGRLDSFRFGETFPAVLPVRIYHSPVSRCRETAEEIFNGIRNRGGQASLEGPVPELGGAAVKGNREELLREMERLGDSFVREWMEERIRPGLMISFHELALRMLRISGRQLSGEKAVFINVTHDRNIMAFLEHFLGLRHEDTGVPEFLTGTAVLKIPVPGKYRILYRDLEAVIDLPD